MNAIQNPMWFITDTKPNWDVSQVVKVVSDLFFDGDTSAHDAPVVDSKSAAQELAWEETEVSAKRVVLASFVATAILVTASMALLVSGIFWAAAFLGSAAIATYGLLYTTGMELNELARKPRAKVYTQ